MDTRFEDVIIEIVEQKQGVKEVELVACLPEWILATYTAEELLELLNEIVLSGKLVKMAYVLPHIIYREKVIYFPAGTKLSVSTDGL